MNVDQLLQYLRKAGIDLWVEKDRLRYSAPKGSITPELLGALRDHKSELLSLLRAKQREHASAPVPAIVPARRDQAIPLSSAQQRLWFLQKLQPDIPVYNMPVALRIQGKLNVSALRQSFAEIIRRHEILRTQIVAPSGTPEQIIAPAPPVSLPVIDIRLLSASEQASQLRHITDEVFYKPFDLEHDLLIRGVLLQRADTEHILAFAWHHIVTDGWSGGIFLHELATCYEAFSQGERSPLPELPVQYADFALWQRQCLSENLLQDQLRYWQEQLRAAPDLLQLPTDAPRPPIQTFHGAAATFQLPDLWLEALKELGRRENVTLFMVLLAAFQTLLFRYTSQEDILVGVPITGRNQSELENLIGCFVNLLVLRTDFSGRPTFLDIIRRVKEVTFQAYSHQDIPFERLVEELRPQRAMDHMPFFQIAFDLQETPSPSLSLPGLMVTLMPVEQKVARLDLRLFLEQQETGMQGFLEYNTDLFTASSIERMIKHFRRLLEAIITNPDQPVTSLSLLSQDERQQLLTEWSGTSMQSPWHACAHTLFEAQAARTPDAIAVVFKQEQLTYRQLNQRANQLASMLHERGVKDETRVGVCLERSVDVLISLLAILKAGGAYVPLDPSYSHGRLAFILEDAQISLLITHRRLQEKLPPSSVPAICIDTETSAITSYAREDPCYETDIRQLAYMIYTSGSTGQPKGVLISHRGIGKLAYAQSRIFGITETSRVLQFASLSFDAAVAEIFVTLLSGATLYLESQDALLSGPILHQTLLEHAITVVTLTPSVLRMLPHQPLPALRTLISAGEPCSADLVDHWSEGRDFYNAYGPTEITVCASIARCTSAKTPSIGRPIANTELYVLDDHLQPVPVGLPGELYIGGTGLARGYHQQPQLTAERFLPHPFSTTPGMRLYKTGDIARWMPDGNLYYLGRRDQQIKLRGMRVELGDVEANIRHHAFVKDVIVIAQQQESYNAQLLAYITLKEHTDFRKTWQQERIAQWNAIFDDTYGQFSLSQDPAADFSGWNSSYTRQPIPEHEMREWVTITVHRIEALKPRRVLEIGCGNGLLLQQLAPKCASYCGTDFSRAALDYLQARLDSQPGMQHVKLVHCTADDLAAMRSEAFDTIIINSVIQYFPSIDYLHKVIQGALSLIAPGGGHIFMGDIRNLDLLPILHTSILLTQAPSSLPLQQLWERVQKRVAYDEELVLAPDFFTALPQQYPSVQYVQLQPKPGQYRNELTMFRYDATLYVHTHRPMVDIPWLHWEREDLSSERLQNILAENTAPYIGIREIPDARLAEYIVACEHMATKKRGIHNVGELRQFLRADFRKTGIDPETLYASAYARHYGVQLYLSNASRQGRYAAVFIKNDTDEETTGNFINHPDTPEKRLSTEHYANDPLRYKYLSHLIKDIRNFLAQRLPDHMVPSTIIPLDALPLNPHGKVDYRALPAPEAERPELESTYIPPVTELEQLLTTLWQDILQVDKIGIYDNFFDLGGHSLLLVQVHTRLRTQIDKDISIVDLFQYPTIHALAKFMANKHQNNEILKHIEERVEARKEILSATASDAKPQDISARYTPRQNERPAPPVPPHAIAIIGMSGRFPQARDIEAFWQNIRDGKESVTFFSEQELVDAGVSPSLLAHPQYVKAGAPLEDVACFDASFFGYSPREAEILDPQQRIFLECAWEALEHAGYNPETYQKAIGLYAGCSMSTYFLFNLYPHQDLMQTMGFYQVMLGNEKDFLPTRTSYKLNLRGPSVNINTACSTGLVAVHMASQSLLHRECEMALAGGVSVAFPQRVGYLYQEGMIASPDGHCRAFDAQARGTIRGDGVGIVVLKLLENALKDGDTIHAVILGSAINNDGAIKTGYTAPGVTGQASVISEALAMADVEADTISYVEAHGTATPLGDPIEVAALTQAFRTQSQKKQFCALGSVKTNVGHLDAAAGVAGLIKAVQALKYRQIPPSLHFKEANPKIDYLNTPFYVNTTLQAWKAGETPRRAGVSSFGIGGTNAHVVLEEAPVAQPSPSSHQWHLVPLSAKNAAALEHATANLAAYLKNHAHISLADLAFTLQVGRKAFSHRRMVICHDCEDLVEALTDREAHRLFTRELPERTPSVVFLFPGQGSHYVSMAQDLYQRHALFRAEIDRCAELLLPHLKHDIRTILFPDEAQVDQAAQQLNRTEFTQPALFVIEYALAQVWMAWGISPQAMIGHSIGEYVAACLAGVFSLEDALELVTARGRLVIS